MSNCLSLIPHYGKLSCHLRFIFLRSVIKLSFKSIILYPCHYQVTEPHTLKTLFCFSPNSRKLPCHLQIIMSRLNESISGTKSQKGGFMSLKYDLAATYRQFNEVLSQRGFLSFTYFFVQVL